MIEPAVRAESIRKSYGAVEVLHGIDLEVQPGEVTCLVGPSGSGKTTFLRCINHLEKISSGRVFVHGELLAYRDSLNPAAIAREIADLQTRMLVLAKDKTEQLYLSTFPSALPDVRSGIRINKAKAS